MQKALVRRFDPPDRLNQRIRLGVHRDDHGKPDGAGHPDGVARLFDRSTQAATLLTQSSNTA